MNTVSLYLLTPLHTGGSTQEGNLVGIARESHTNLPYIPSSSLRGRLRAAVTNGSKDPVLRAKQARLFGLEISDFKEEGEFPQEYRRQTGKAVVSENFDQKLTQLEQGDIWIGDGSLLWVPVPSLSHGVVWVTSPLLLLRWLRFRGIDLAELGSKMPEEYSFHLSHTNKGRVYLKDAIIPLEEKNIWQNWESSCEIFLPANSEAIDQVLVLPNRHCATLIQMSLWRQVKIKLGEHKTVDGGFRYEEAIPPDTLMYFIWGATSQASGSTESSVRDFEELLNQQNILQIGGQESLGRGFVELNSIKK